MKIQDKVALVTGGASGLGRATAEGLLEAGASVVVVDLPGSDGPRAEKELGDKVRFAAADVTNEAEVRAAVELAVKEFGGHRFVVTSIS